MVTTPVNALPAPNNRVNSVTFRNALITKYFIQLLTKPNEGSRLTNCFIKALFLSISTSQLPLFLNFVSVKMFQASVFMALSSSLFSLFIESSAKTSQRSISSSFEGQMLFSDASPASLGCQSHLISVRVISSAKHCQITFL